MPYKSQAQAAYFNIHKKELESKGVNVQEWNQASKGKHLPAKLAGQGKGNSHRAKLVGGK